MSAARKASKIKDLASAPMITILNSLGYTVMHDEDRNLINPETGRYVIDIGFGVAFFSKNNVLLGTLSHKTIRELV